MEFSSARPPCYYPCCSCKERDCYSKDISPSTPGSIPSGANHFRVPLFCTTTSFREWTFIQCSLHLPLHWADYVPDLTQFPLQSSWIRGIDYISIHDKPFTLRFMLRFWEAHSQHYTVKEEERWDFRAILCNFKVRLLYIL